ncbi:MAG: ATP-binding protein [Ilumatobacteraceae bacterium]
MTDATWFRFGSLLIHDLFTRSRDDSATESTDGSSTGDLDGAREELRDSLSGSSPFASLVFNAGMSVDAAEILAVATAAEVDHRLRHLIGAAQSNPGSSVMTLGVIRSMFQSDAVVTAELGPESLLRRAALVDVTADGAWSDSHVEVQPAVVWALLGDIARDPQLPGDLEVIEVDRVEGSEMVVVTGPDRIRRRLQAAERARGSVFLVTAAPATQESWAALVREATITGAGVIIELDNELSAIGRRWIERTRHLTWAVTSRTDIPYAQLPNRQWTSVAAGDAPPSDEEWVARVGDAPRTHPLTMTQLDQVGRAISSYGGDLDAAVRRLASGRLEQLARRIRPRQSWDDLVLSANGLSMLRSIIDRYRLGDRVYDDWGFTPAPSRGLVALFSGPSGTGKTMATEVVAGELGLDVFKINLSAVVSKYIGETEKNLEEMFDAAAAGNLLLFFDEADSLIGKRSEVKDSKDRYANIEVSYLLQRLETYDGLVFMATNFEKNIDDAFLRRIHVRLPFPMPAPAERLALWQRNLPPRAPTKNLDLQWLADNFEVSGGSIRNITVNAAFLAAAQGKPIEMEHLVTGLAGELRKAGRILQSSHFGEFGHLLDR